MTDKDLTRDLRRLGAAVEAATPPTASPTPSTGIPSARTRPARMLAGIGAVAAAIVIVIAVIATRSSTDPTTDVAVAAASGNTDPANADWRALRHCESTGDYTTDTGNSFYGAYQFTAETWQRQIEQHGLEGRVGRFAAQAPAHVQDTLAGELYLERGAQPWPICGHRVDSPMHNPLVASWLRDDEPAAQAAGTRLVLFLVVDATPAQIDAVSDRLSSVAEPSSVRFRDQQAVWHEFRHVVDLPRGAEALGPDDMPTALTADTRDPVLALARLDDLPQVLSVVEIPAPPPRRVQIPALAIDRRLGRLTTVDALFEHVVAIEPVRVPTSATTAPGVRAPSRDAPLVLTSTMPDWGLGHLKAGDLITIDTVFGDAMLRIEARVTAAARSVPVADLHDGADLGLGAVVLLAVDPHDPRRRLVVATERVDPTVGWPGPG